MEKELASLLSLTTLIATQYNGLMGDLHFTSLQKRSGTLLGCHVCYDSRVTLYKDGDERICAKCRKKREDERNEA